MKTKKLNSIMFWVFILTLMVSCKSKTEEKTQQVVEEVTEAASDMADEVSEKVSEMKYADKSVDDEIAAKISAYLLNDALKNDIAVMTEADRKYQMYKIDLNGDGADEYLVRFMSPYFCGTGGCTFYLLSNEMKPITKFTVTEAPFWVSRITDNNWRIMMVKDKDGYKKLIYKDGKYPSNPSLLPVSAEAPSGNDEIIFDEDFSPAKTYTF